MIFRREKPMPGARWFHWIQLLLIVLWGTQLLNSDAYYVNYLLLLIAAGCCFRQNSRRGEMPGQSRSGAYIDWILRAFALFFSCMVTFSNYSIWLPSKFETYGRFKSVLWALIFLSGGYFAFWHIFRTITSNLSTLVWQENTRQDTRPGRVFLSSFVPLVLTRAVVLFGCHYPGELTPDSRDQIVQILTGVYTNQHPFYHTLLIRCFFNLGMFLFRDINAAVATFSFAQILMTSLCFSFAVSTMVQLKAPRWMRISTILFYLLMPYHILYAITIWKDVLYGCLTLLFVTVFARLMLDVGSRAVNDALLTVSAFGMCLFRTNGLFSFAILSIACVFIFWRKNKGMLIALLSVVMVSFVLKHAVLARLQVTQPDTIAGLAIPSQQIARVVTDGYELDDWQEELLSEIIDIDRIPGTYVPYNTDPIKRLVREKGNQQAIVENRREYLKLYLSLGLKYPKEYLKGWIDQTRGYWNAGYEYWRWAVRVISNDVGIERTTRVPWLDTLITEYAALFPDTQALRPFLSIGLFVWLDLLAAMIGLIRRDPLGVFLALPVLTIVLSLLVATPVASEFRYIYAVFCALPMVLVVNLRPFKAVESEGRETKS